MIKTYSRAKYYYGEELSKAMNWLLTQTNNDYKFDIDIAKVPECEVQLRKNQLHQLNCNEFIKLNELTNDNHLLGNLTVKGLIMMLVMKIVIRWC